MLEVFLKAVEASSVDLLDECYAFRPPFHSHMHSIPVVTKDPKNDIIVLEGAQ